MAFIGELPPNRENDTNATNATLVFLVAGKSATTATPLFIKSSVVLIP